MGLDGATPPRVTGQDGFNGRLQWCETDALRLTGDGGDDCGGVVGVLV